MYAENERNRCFLTLCIYILSRAGPPNKAGEKMSCSHCICHADNSNMPICIVTNCKPIRILE